LGLLEVSVTSGESDGQELAESTTNGVGDGEGVGHTELEGEGGNLGDGGLELSDDIGGGDVEGSGVVEETTFVDLGDDNTVEERLDVELGQEGDVGSGDAITLLDEVDLVDDFNSTLNDLGGDVQGLEERGLTGVETSSTRGDKDIDGGGDTRLGGSRDFELHDGGADFSEGTVDEDETDVTDEGVVQLDQVGNFLVGLVGVNVILDDLAHDGVLTDDDDTTTTDGHTDLLHLERTDVVDGDDHDVLVGFEELLKATTELVLAILAFLTGF